jgi:hypothetical protein
MATKADKELAFEAGVRNATTEPPERRGVAACPFEPGDELRAEWLRGFEEGLNQGQAEADIRKELADALDLEDAS